MSRINPIYKITVFTILAFLINIEIASSQIIINEVCASNSNLISDFEGDYNDWIEITNIGSEPVNLAGYCLRDDADDHSQWCFPEYMLGPGEYLLLFASGKDIKSLPINWKTLVSEGDLWKYIVPASEIPLWRSVDFNESSWSTGASGIGYGDGDDATTIPSTLSLYMRISFNLNDASQIDAAALHIDYDDGFVAYINGNEIARSLVSGTPPDFDARATGLREATMYSGGKPERYDISNPGSVFLNGKNILAIEVHNDNDGSSDMTAIPFLSILSSGETGSPPPVILDLPGKLFHTNFKLNSDGDSLYLSDPTGAVLDSFIFSTQKANHSFGKRPDFSSDWWLFETPTPGSENITPALNGYVNDLPIFSVPGGTFANPFQLAITAANSGDTIYYTADGSEPDAGSTRYSGPLSISTGTVIRAKILRQGYISGEDVIETYMTRSHTGIPVLAISTDPYNFFDFNYGIYELGPNAQNSNPHFGANFWMDWERPVNVTMYESDTISFSVDVGAKIYGAWSRANPQKSLAFYARNQYGDKNIQYKFFEEKSIDKFEAFILRNSGNDYYGGNGSSTQFRDAMMTRITKDMGLEYQATRQAAAYINGKYWGVLNIREKINEHFLASNTEIDPDKVEMLTNNQEVVIGSSAHYASLIDFVNTNTMSYQSNYAYVKLQMDIQNFINYELSQIYFDNTDWPGNNVKFWRPATESGKWRWILYDTDFGFGMWDLNKVYHNTLAFATEPNGPGWPNPPWSTLLLRKLLLNSEFKNQFINSFADHLNTTFLRDTVNKVIDEMTSTIDAEMNHHVSRWGGSHQNWLANTNNLKIFADRRPAEVRKHIRNKFFLDGEHAVALNVSDENGGIVGLNTIFIRQFPWSGIYFEEVPIEITAIPSPGYIFTGWTGAVTSDEPYIKVSVTGAKSIVANFEPDPNPANRVVINEVCYNSDSLNSSGDWVELANKSDQYVDLSGWIIKDGNNMHTYVIKKGTILEPFGYQVISKNKYKFADIHHKVNNYQGNLTYGLSGLGDIVRLYNTEMEMVNFLSYGVNTPWPIIPSGSGYTLALLNPDKDNFLSTSWRVSNEKYGTPGSQNFTGTVDIDVNPAAGPDQLFQNSPNPFNQSTRIILYSSTYQAVKLSVYDLNGRLVDVLADQNMAEGHHEIDWAPKESGSGMFILRMETPNTVLTKRIMRTQ